MHGIAAAGEETDQFDLVGRDAHALGAAEEGRLWPFDGAVARQGVAADVHGTVVEPVFGRLQQTSADALAPKGRIDIEHGDVMLRGPLHILAAAWRRLDGVDKADKPGRRFAPVAAPNVMPGKDQPAVAVGRTVQNASAKGLGGQAHVVVPIREGAVPERNQGREIAVVKRTQRHPGRCAYACRRSAHNSSPNIAGIQRLGQADVVGALNDGPVVGKDRQFVVCDGGLDQKFIAFDAIGHGR